MPYPDEPRPSDFHARLTRVGRARPVLSRQAHRLRKRYAMLVAAILVPAIASATEWPAAPAASAPAIDRAALQTAAYERLA